MRNNGQADRVQHHLARLSTRSAEESLDAADWAEPVEEEPPVRDNSATGRVQRLLQALPANFRDVLTCRFLLNLSIRDTARGMGLTEANVKVMQSRALKRAAELEWVVSGS